MYYQINRLRAQTKNTDPSLTDQSQAAETDINIIVKRMMVTGTVPVSKTKAIAGDFTELPTDLRAMIEQSRSIKKTRLMLPESLREMPIEELLELTPDKLTSILTPPTPPTPATEEIK